MMATKLISYGMPADCRRGEDKHPWKFCKCICFVRLVLLLVKN